MVMMAMTDHHYKNGGYALDKTAREAYSDAVLQEVISRFGAEPGSIKALNGFESFIYEYTRHGQELVLRVTHSGRRSTAEIEGELDWLNYLADNEVPAARAVPSAKGNFVEVVPGANGFSFLAASFVKAAGVSARKPEVWNTALFNEMGRIMGRMHRLTKSYQPSKPALKRPYLEIDFDGMERFIPADQTIVIEKAHAIREQLGRMPKDKESYGLIHFDFHRGNFFVDNGKITLFDFDDCLYGWFATDIAISLFYAVPHHCESKEDLGNATRFMDYFMEGYFTEHKISAQWMSTVPLFLKQREIDLYAVVHRSMDINNLDQWGTSYMTRRRWKIENDIPFVDLDFRQWGS
jgi:Ser/Thr protein kinase RdoA (MazF antagonist)